MPHINKEEYDVVKQDDQRQVTLLFKTTGRFIPKRKSQDIKRGEGRSGEG